MDLLGLATYVFFLVKQSMLVADMLGFCCELKCYRSLLLLAC